MPELRLVDADGQLVERDRTYQQVVDENEGLKNRVGSLAGQITQLQRELAQVRGIEPDSKKVTEVLEFYRDFSGRSIAIDPATQRYAKVRARLRQKCDPPFTVDRLKRAIVGAPKAEWFKDRPERQDPQVIFNTAENVEKCEVAAGRPTQKVRQVVDLTPLEAASQALAREFGFDVVRREGEEVWAPCPLHADAKLDTTLRISERGPRGSLVLQCVLGCEADEILEALRVLYALQAKRDPGEEIAGLRVRVHELERGLRIYAAEKWWDLGGPLEKDRGETARVVLGGQV